MNIIKSLLAMSLALSVCIAQDINISGTVTDTGGTPIVKAAVMLEKHGYKDTTDVTGNFLLTGAIGINDQINHYVPYTLSTTIKNGLLYIKVAEKSAVEITTYTLQGKIISAINKTMDVGIHSVALPRTGAGLYFYKIKTNGREFVIKNHSTGIISTKTAVSTQGPSSIALAKEARRYIAIDDVIAVSKAGYLNYRVIVTNSDTSGIETKMIVCAGIVTDIEGNEYQAVTIGNQVWMAENLRTTKYNDGTVIPHITDSDEWFIDTVGAYCYYNNDSAANSEKYGILYNWFVVNTGKIAPTGWHVPSDKEWDTLQNFLIENGYNWDGTTDSNRIAKSLATKTDWSSLTIEGSPGNDKSSNNSSGFSGLAGGFRYNFDDFSGQGKDGSWWSATGLRGAYAYYRNLYYSDDYLHRYYNDNGYGFSIRLIKD